jgi:hypothetical protein
MTQEEPSDGAVRFVRVQAILTVLTATERSETEETLSRGGLGPSRDRLKAKKF